MSDRTGIFSGEDPFDLIRAWLHEADAVEPNDPNAIALATVDAAGMPDVRMVLLKDIDGQAADGSFVIYTNYDSAKGVQIAQSGTAAFVMHWKSLRRQVRVRGTVTKEDGPQADAYYDSRGLQSRLGAWASPQSRPLDSRADLERALAVQTDRQGDAPRRPPFWGGLRITPTAIEFWADGAHRLHDRFLWTRAAPGAPWAVTRLAP